MTTLWQGFWQVADPKIWVASTVPMAVGGALAYGLTGQFSWYWFLISMLGVFLIEIGKNAANDLVDYESGVDLMVAPDKRTPFSGGKRAIVDGNLTLSQARWITLATLAAGSLIGFYIAFMREPGILWIGLSGLFFAAAYSLPPFKLAYRGLGEAVVGVTFGPLIVSGTFLVQAHFLSWEVILASLPIGLLIANVLFINQYPDYEADLQGNKRNWVVRLGKTKGLSIYKALFAGTYLSFVGLFATTLNPFWLMSFVSLPLVIQAVGAAARYSEDIPKMIVANANTIKTYQLTGLTMVLAAILTRFFV
ncbi:prenyltransferase [Dethiobacter alkaliphilus]|uniref:1,4-dihydroxy-2-naphthoate octaprenyltransferase n=1 Tax=Dethiobacter alkaliphilus AHT 1 TaxID=555088 RepID=C0GDG9_DETAL|nr:prenyltransferase [Dethiobacter alkaliphilus]EEG78690.1 1,4-dihydroxy-2-naphthoate octaprenyltransferase [Dethiobacter alkaliphilus AHT 1]